MGLRGDDSSDNLRADLSDLRGDRLAPPVRLPEGGLRGEMIVATAGEVLEYRDPTQPTGIRREYVPRAALEDPAFLESLKLRPLILAPNEVHWTTLRPEDVKRWRVGQVGETLRWDGDDLVASYVIDTDTGLAAIESGLRSVSVGYSVRADGPPGIAPDGSAYDVMQTPGTRRGNHVILTQRGRVARAQLRADEALTMDPKKLAAALAAIEITLRADADEAATAATIGEALAAAKGEAAGHKQRADAAEPKAAKVDELTTALDAAHRGDSAEVIAAFAARGPLLDLAAQHKVEGADKLGNSAIGKAVAVKLGCRADASDTEIAGFLAGVAKASEASGPTVGDLRRGTGTHRADNRDVADKDLLPNPFRPVKA